MEDFFSHNCEKLPNKDVSHLPDNFLKFEVWKIFKSKLSHFDQCAKMTYQFWCKIWEKYFLLVKIPKVNCFEACADCEEFKIIHEKAMTIEEKIKHH
jgi:hypothetical protein